MTGVALVAGRDLEFRFKNYRDEWETRHVVFHGVDFGANSHYADRQWFIRCWDVERGEQRSFPLERIDPETLRILEPRVSLVVGCPE